MTAAASNEDTGHALPAEPVVRIRPSGGRAVVDLREVWSYRELLFFLAWRDVKIRYKQAVLGIAWAVLQPFVTMVVFTLFFGKLAKVPSDGIPYPIFSYAALLPWSFFQAAVTNGGNSLVGSSHLIKKVYFPRLLVPASAVGAALVDFAIAFVMFVALFAYYRVAVTAQLLLLPVLVVLTTALALAVALWTSALNVKYRDVRHALPFVLQVWMFVSPVIYPSSMMPEQWRWLLALNPLTGLIDGYRASLLGRPVPWGPLSYTAAVTVGLLFLATIEFRRMEREFADIV